MIRYPLSTEKAIRLLESENKMIFVVDLKDTKSQIKQELESSFKVKVLKVNTLIDRDGKKRAIISLSPETPAIDLATNLGLM
ncbi:MAG: 50S ribosomal protein L23 [Candidatus Woesearchaeota archaeon]